VGWLRGVRPRSSSRSPCLRGLVPRSHGAAAFDRLAAPARPSVQLSIESRDYVIYSNLGEKNVGIKLEWRYFNSAALGIQDGGTLNLRPHQTIVLLKIDDTRGPYLIGSKGYILPGGQVVSFYYESGELKIELGKNLSPETEIYIGVDKSMKTLNVNGKLHNAADMGEYGRIVIKI
jgi:hypothetical protein